MKQDNLYKIRHSCEHVFNQAIEELWPGKITRALGPPIENGWYNDSRWEVEVNEKDFPKIEKKMKEIIKKDLPITKKVISKSEAKELFKDNPFKQEILEGIEDKKVSIYSTGDEFSDLCKGPHVKSTGEIKAFKLLSTAGAYWRGNEKNEMLTRVYGTAFPSQKELDKFLTTREEAIKRDHKKLGKALDLFVFSDLVGAGLPLWTPKGTLIRDLLDDFVWSIRKKKGYDKVEIPHITKKELYIKSGHWDKFADELFHIKTREGHEFVMKPMNCPHHTQIFARKLWSYKELPQRYSNTTMCYRDEQTGELNGLSRTRAFTQDDSHVFCTKEQAKEEINSAWDIINEFYSRFEFKLKPRLSTHDPNNMKAYLGTSDIWKESEDMLRNIAKDRGPELIEEPGEAAFYGPKIDFLANDSLGREWQVGTIQLDFNMPEAFKLNYVNEKGKKERVVMLHVAIMGSIERFLSILIEHTAGNLPFWLSPEQIWIIPIGEGHHEYAKEVAKKLSEFRVVVKTESESLGKKIRAGELQKIPYLLIVGDKEMKNKKISVRFSNDGDLTSVRSFLHRLPFLKLP